MEKFCPTSKQTLVEILAARAIQSPNAIAYTFIEESGEQSLTYSQLYARMCNVAGLILEHVNPGEPVILLYPPGLDYVVAFYACLRAGVTAVPLYPPRLKQRTDRIAKVIDNCKADLALTTRGALSGLQTFFSQNVDAQHFSLLAFDAADGEFSDEQLPALPERDALAFIQYTSGSTGSPKGVMVSHRNVTANLEALRQAASCTEDDVFADWLPLFHDLGLVCTLLLPAYLGCHSILMAPVRFIQQPVRWFQAITKYSATIGGAPNFAYKLCLSKIKPAQMQDIDLSSWRIAFNAAEPINADVLQDFVDRFGEYGFSETAIYPSYGMAEATVFITGGSREQCYKVGQFDPAQLAQRVATHCEQDGQRLVSCGTIANEHTLLIVDPETCSVMNEGQIGEIWVAGPSVAQGYLAMPELTARDFQAKTAAGDGNYLRTGDLGFLLDGELYVNGRIKDIMIVRGRNYYPQDIELASENSHEVLSAGSAIAFTTERGNDTKIVIVQEVKPTVLRRVGAEELTDTIRQAIADEFELKVDVVFISVGKLPKTSSGKVQRSLAKMMFEGDEFGELVTVAAQSIGSDQPASHPSKANFDVAADLSIEGQVKAIWQTVLNVANPTESSDFYACGGDSLDATNLLAGIERCFGIVLEPEFIYEYPTLTTFTQAVSRHINSQQTATTSRLIAAGQQTKGPTSYAQRRLWFLSQMPGQNKVLGLPCSIALNGELDLPKLEESLATLIQRHEILRTTYLMQDGEIQQILHDDIAFQLPVQDLSQHLHPEVEAQQIATIHAQCVFDLEKGPVFSIKLLKLAPQQHHLLINVHHIAADAWSFQVLIEELNRLYAGQVLEQKPEIRYLDFAMWQHQLLQDDAMLPMVDYWKSHLQGAPSLLNLPYDMPRPARQTFNGAAIQLPLPEPLLKGLQALSITHKTTLFTTLLSVYQVFLQRLSGQDDIVVGTDIANRNHPQIADVFGFFVNQLVIRNQPNNASNFEALIASNRQIFLASSAHQDMPFDKLVEVLDVERSPQYSPLFQVKFLLNHSPVNALDLAGIEGHPLAQKIEVAQYDLTLCADMQGDGSCCLSLHYNSDLFHESTIRQLLAYYLQLATHLLAEPTAPLAQIDMLNAEQQRQLLRLGEGEQVALNADDSLTSLFEAQVENTPDRVAVSFEGQTVTYAQLNQRANRLAHFLADADIGADAIVGIHMARSINMVAALIAIQKVGAGFLPLDPSYPEERIEYMLEDSQITLLLCENPDDPALENFYGVALPIDDELSIVDDQPSENIALAYNANSAAYLLYTSGSSGKPKGVVVENHSLFNLCDWYSRFAEVTEMSSVALVIPLSFDASIKNVFTPLICGAELVLAGNGPFDAKYMNQMICERQVSIINCVPSFMYSLIEDAAKADYAPLQSLHVVALGGEATNLSTLRPWLTHPNCHSALANIYGPTECTDISVASCYSNAQITARSGIPIGKAIQNVRAYVLDQRGRPCLLGVAGELVLAGQCVARGYWENAETTAERFIEDTFTGNGKMYRTGDMVKQDSDGNLHYIGRLDEQVKINGIRIEVAEIEAALSQHPLLNNAVVVAKEKCLLAFAECSLLTPPTQSQIKTFLREKLPETYIPAQVFCLDALPSLPNGKVDKQQLASMAVFDVAQGRDIQPADTDIEALLIDVFRAALSLDDVGVTENFFDLGGDSILAVKTVALAEERHCLFTVADIFEYQTVRQLAQHVLLSEQQTTQNSQDEAFDMLSGDDMSVLFDDA